MRTRVEGWTVDEHPGLPNPVFGVPWGHEPVGPFRTQAWHQSGDRRMASVETYTHFNTAMARFAWFFIPPLPGYTAVLLDEGFRVVLGNCMTDDLLRDCMGTAGWYGVRASFEWLEGIEEHDPMMLTGWEAVAMGNATEVEL